MKLILQNSWSRKFCSVKFVHDDTTIETSLLNAKEAEALLDELKSGIEDLEQWIEYHKPEAGNAEIEGE